MPFSPSKIIKAEPALVVGFLVGLVILVAGNFGIILDEITVEAVIGPIVAAFLVRPAVTPNGKVVLAEGDEIVIPSVTLDAQKVAQAVADQTGSTLTVRDPVGNPSLVIAADAQPREPSPQEVADAKQELGL